MTRARKPFAHFTDERDAGRDLAQALELFFEVGAGDDAEIAREVAMTLLDLVHDRLPLVAQRETRAAARDDR